MTKVTDYKQNLNSAEAVRILSVDPTIVPIDGFKGQLAVSYDLDNPKIWQKQDFGKTTNWIKLVGINKNVLPDDTVPLSISGLAAWYDFSENVASKIEIDSNFRIIRAFDQSLNTDVNRDIVQNTFNRQALWTPAVQNGLGSALFDRDYYSLPFVIRDAISNNSDFTIFTTVRQTLDAGSNHVISDSSSRTYIRYISGVNPLEFSVNNNDTDRSLPTRSTFNNNVLRRDGTNFDSFVLDVPVNNSVGGPSPNSSMYLGASQTFNLGTMFVGYVSEVIIYLRTLTDTEVQDVLTYLKNKWNTV